MLASLLNTRNLHNLEKIVIFAFLGTVGTLLVCELVFFKEKHFSYSLLLHSFVQALNPDTNRPAVP
jgi:hypothetical protein